jgi:hypothetical protein
MESSHSSLLNEYKGNIFEYLVAAKLARHFGLEAKFINSLSPDFLSLLKNYEQFIRNYYIHLLLDLDSLASATTMHIVSQLGLTDIEAIYLTGKLALVNANLNIHEGDILIYLSEKKVIPLSLKLAKQHSFVNAKSAGIKSIITKYFKTEDAQVIQQDLTKAFDDYFLEMSLKLHATYDVDFDIDYKNWQNLGYSELPGELNEEGKSILYDFYYKIVQKLYSLFLHFYKNNQEMFNLAIKQLSGFSSDDIVQVTCFYSTNTKDQHYQLVSIQLKEYSHKMFQDLKILPLKAETAGFEISGNEFTVQFRIKPMNKFTAKSYKVNVALKS